jgi:hypothetical protein
VLFQLERPVAQPTPYSRQYNFTNYQTVSPSSPLPAAQVDLELNSVKSTLDQTLNNLKLIQRDDTALANKSVGLDQLKDEVTIGINSAYPVGYGDNYIVGDTVTQAGAFYRCAISHVSGVFATDLAAVKWTLIVDFNAVLPDIATSIHGAVAKTIPNDSDELPLADSAAAWVLKKITWANIKAQMFAAWGALINTGTGKTTPVDADAFAIMDSAAGNATKTLTLANLKTAVLGSLGTVIAALTGKTTPIAADSMVISDSAAAGVAKSVTLTNFWTTTLAAFGPLIAVLTAKTTPVDSDGVALIDSAASSAPKFLSWANLKAAIASYLRTTGGANAYPTGHLWGLTLSNNAGTPASKIDIAAGVARSSDDSDNLDLLVAITAKDLSVAWAVGSSAGMLATGVAVANGTYHIFEIKRPDTGVVDVAADSSVTGANIAANTNAAYTKKRRIGSIVRSGGSIVAFTQVGDKVMLSTPVVDITASNPGTSAVTRTLASIPTGIVVDALLTVNLNNSAAALNFNMSFSSLDTTDVAVARGTSRVISMADGATSAGNVAWQGAEKVIRTNTSAQIRSRASASDASCTLYIQTDGWIDFRGRTA